MKIACIGLGTNSMKMLLADYDGSTFSNRRKTAVITRLGKSLDASGRIEPAAFEENLAQLEAFYHQAQAVGAHKIYAFGTSALRDAANREEFITRARRQTGLEVEAIGGEKEAELGFVGVTAGLPSAEGSLLVVDIGGGSTELVVGAQKQGIAFKTSANVGAVRLTERCLRDDPPTLAQVQSACRLAQDALKEPLAAVRALGPRQAVGIGGTANTLFAMRLGLERYDSAKIHGGFLERTSLLALRDRFLTLDQSARLQTPGLDPKRADIITAGMLLLGEILEETGFSGLTISDYDNLEGYVCHKYSPK